MNQLDDYEDLFSFLTAEFADADFEGKTDADVVQACVKPELAGWYRRILKEGHAILKRRQFPWQEVSDYANRDFMSEEDVRAWLQSILDLLEQRLTLISPS